MDFAHSERAQALRERVTAFIRERIAPAEATWRAQLAGGSDWRMWRQPPVMEALKAQAREAGLWNLFLPDAEHNRLFIKRYKF